MVVYAVVVKMSKEISDIVGVQNYVESMFLESEAAQARSDELKKTLNNSRVEAVDVKARDWLI